MTTTQTLKFKRGTWLSARGQRAEVKLGRGKRLDVMTWIDQADERNGSHPAGTTVVTVSSGDGRTPTFVRHAEVTLAPGVDFTETVEQLVAEWSA